MCIFIYVYAYICIYVYMDHLEAGDQKSGVCPRWRGSPHRGVQMMPGRSVQAAAVCGATSNGSAHNSDTIIAVPCTAARAWVRAGAAACRGHAAPGRHRGVFVVRPACVYHVQEFT